MARRRNRLFLIKAQEGGNSSGIRRAWKLQGRINFKRLSSQLVPHTHGSSGNIPIPPGIYDEVNRNNQGKDKEGCLERSNSSYGQNGSGVLKRMENPVKRP